MNHPKEDGGLYLQTSNKVWQIFLERLVELGREGKSNREIGQMLDVSHMAVGRWLSGERGKTDMPLDVTLERLEKLGVTPIDVMNKLSPEEAVYIVAFIDEYSDYVKDLAKILQAGGLHFDHLLETIKLLAKRIDIDEKK